MSSSWIPVAACDELEEDDTRLVTVEGRDVCLYRLPDAVYATDNLCTHGDAELSDGLVLDSALIECPLHEGTFDIRTGKAVGSPCSVDVRCHEVRVEAGVIYLRLAE